MKIDEDILKCIELIHCGLRDYLRIKDIGAYLKTKAVQRQLKATKKLSKLLKV